jgi:predicted DCC family thiol-disulfide oxidoreductase YuxK
MRTQSDEQEEKRARLDLENQSALLGEDSNQSSNQGSNKDSGELAQIIEKAKGKDIIFFDGVCGLCDRFVQFVLEHDDGHFYFASLQSPLAKYVLARHGVDTKVLSSVYLVRAALTPQERRYKRSDAALRIMGDCRGASSLLKGFLVIPTFLRDPGYNLVAAVRYRLFGKRDACRIPAPQERDRFLDL